LIYAGAGALSFVIPATAVALGTGTLSASTGGAPVVAASTQLNVASSPLNVASTPLNLAVTRPRIGYGDDVRVTGNVSGANVGRTLLLEFALSGSPNWRVIDSARVSRGGRFTLAAPLHRSGFVRVIAGTSTAAASADSLMPSSSEHVTVTAALHLQSRSIGTPAGQTVDVRGQLLPAVAGRTVRLQARSNGAWHTLTSARTRPSGGFDLRYLPRTMNGQPLRVGFAGDQLNDSVSRPAGSLAVLTQSVASWYDDAGGTACGFHSFYGVANKVLPCGTEVSFSLDGRSVTAVVDDRGPFIAGREWDLNQNTAAALGFSGVETVWASR
jgi:hypothetical protein